MKIFDEILDDLKVLEKKFASPHKFSISDKTALFVEFLKRTKEKILVMIAGLEQSRSILKIEADRLEDKEKNADKVMASAKGILENSVHCSIAADEKIAEAQRVFLSSVADVEEAEEKSKTAEQLLEEVKERESLLKTLQNEVQKRQIELEEKEKALDGTSARLIELSKESIERMTQADARFKEASEKEVRSIENISRAEARMVELDQREEKIVLDEAENKKERDNINAKEKNLDTLREELLAKR